MEISTLTFSTLLIIFSVLISSYALFYIFKKKFSTLKTFQYTQETAPAHIIKPKTYIVTNKGIQKSTTKFIRYTVPERNIVQSFNNTTINIKFQNSIKVVNK